MRSGVALVVDDSDVVRPMLTRMLAEAGLPAAGVRTALEALDFLANRADDVSLVIIDANLAAQDDGLSLAAAVHDAHPLLAIVVTSGDPGSLDRAAKVAGVVHTLSKPAPPGAVTELLRWVVPG